MMRYQISVKNIRQLLRQKRMPLQEREKIIKETLLQMDKISKLFQISNLKRYLQKKQSQRIQSVTNFSIKCMACISMLYHLQKINELQKLLNSIFNQKSVILRSMRFKYKISKSLRINLINNFPKNWAFQRKDILFYFNF